VQGQVVRAHPPIGLVRLKLPPQVSVSQAIDTLYRSGAVEYAEPNVLIIPQAIPNDLQFLNQWGLHNEGGAGGTAGADIKAPEAWDIITRQCPRASIHRVVDRSRLPPEFSPNMWVNPVRYHLTNR
jgi:hypothetical protein